MWGETEWGKPHRNKKYTKQENKGSNFHGMKNADGDVTGKGCEGSMTVIIMASTQSCKEVY